MNFDLSNRGIQVALLVLFGVVVGIIFIATGNSEAATSVMSLITAGAGILMGAAHVRRRRKKRETAKAESEESA
jgi:membrane protease YdiL (CAAX protease family)